MLGVRTMYRMKRCSLEIVILQTLVFTCIELYFLQQRANTLFVQPGNRLTMNLQTHIMWSIIGFFPPFSWFDVSEEPISCQYLFSVPYYVVGYLMIWLSIKVTYLSCHIYKSYYIYIFYFSYCSLDASISGERRLNLEGLGLVPKMLVGLAEYEWVVGCG